MKFSEYLIIWSFHLIENNLTKEIVVLGSSVNDRSEFGSDPPHFEIGHTDDGPRIVSKCIVETESRPVEGLPLQVVLAVRLLIEHHLKM